MLAAWQGVSKRTDASFYSWLAFYDVILQGALSRISKALQKNQATLWQGFWGFDGREFTSENTGNHVFFQS